MKSFFLTLLKYLLLIVLVLNFIPASHTVSYTKSWSFERGDAFKIEIYPDIQTVQPGQNYTFTIILSPMSFALNQTRFSNISVQLRYIVADAIVTGPKIGTFTFGSLASSITNHTVLSIPSAKALDVTKNSGGSLQYLLNYNLDFTTENITYASTGWSMVSIVNLSISTSPNNTFLYAIVVIVFFGVFALSLRLRKKNIEKSQTQDSEIAKEEIPKKEFE